MRQLHPKAIEIIANNPKHPAYPISHCWSEVFLWLSNKQKHPKVFITSEYDLGIYLGYIYLQAENKGGCNLDKEKLKSLHPEIIIGFNEEIWMPNNKTTHLSKYFNDNNLFSDACSLYYKGVNIFPDLFGEDWKKYCPVISHKEIIRQCEKTEKAKQNCNCNV